jgi:hypothetical protein
MKVLTVHFPPADGHTLYDRMLAVLKRSLAYFSPATPLIVLEDDGSVMRAQAAETEARTSYIANTHKLRLWHAAVQALPDGERFLLIDSDMICQGDLSPAAEWASDITITTKPPGSRFPFNSGVVGVRGGPFAREFFERWLRLCVDLLEDRPTHEIWRKTYGGINQASLGMLMDHAPELAVRVGRVPCAHWNAEESSWPRLGPDTKLIHVKGRFRQALAGGLIVDLAKDRATLKPLVAKFHDWEKEALAYAA